jgi:hypothetical protein
MDHVEKPNSHESVSEPGKLERTAPMHDMLPGARPSRSAWLPAATQMPKRLLDATYPDAGMLSGVWGCRCSLLGSSTRDAEAACRTPGPAGYYGYSPWVAGR